MGLAKKRDRIREEKINGVIYDMSPAPHFRHGLINSNIHTIIKQGLKNSMCIVTMENLDFKYQPDVNDDYLCPDIMVICDRSHLKGGAYSGVPRFVAETLSPSTTKRDRTDKKGIYESSGVEELWIISPRERAVEIYYLEDGKYSLTENYILQDDVEEAYYNADTEIALRAFPHIRMTLADIFEGVE